MASSSNDNSGTPAARRARSGVPGSEARPANSGPLVFVHLSDIHFRRPKFGGKYDLDADLRNELHRDAIGMTKELGTPASILVTGDIAFSASVEEYEIASKWLKTELFDATGCPGEDICCIPGNHDVDWNHIRRSKPIRDCHASIRGQKLHLLDSAIQEYLPDPFVFYRALENYNAFALQFGCDLSVENPYWSRDFLLNDGSILRVRGVNSALISDELDNDRNGNLLVLGSHQCTMKNEDGVEHLFLCHHPPQWLLDQDQVEELIQRARIQMFGHKHEQRLTEIDHHLRVSAGAVHPDRPERDWKPRYNWMSIVVTGEGDRRSLVVDVYPRVWSKQQKFVPDFEECNGQEKRSYSLPINSWTRPSALAPASPNVPAVADESARQLPANAGAVEKALVDPARTLAHRFLSLSFVKRVEVAQALKLLRDEDAGLQEIERSKRIFVRAKEQRQLALLWEEVERRHADGKHPHNPFE